MTHKHSLKVPSAEKKHTKNRRPNTRIELYRARWKQRRSHDRHSKWKPHAEKQPAHPRPGGPRRRRGPPRERGQQQTHGELRNMQCEEEKLYEKRYMKRADRKANVCETRRSARPSTESRNRRAVSAFSTRDLCMKDHPRLMHERSSVLS